MGKSLAHLVELLTGFLLTRAAEQHDEFLAAMAGDVAIVAADLGQRRSDSLDHAVAGIVPVRIVDALEVIDVAKCHAERVERCLRLAIVLLDKRFERAAVGQSGQVIVIGIAAGLGEIRPQCRGLSLATVHFLFEMLGALKHRPRQFGEIQDFRLFLGLAGLVDVNLHFAVVLRGGRARVATGRRESFERAFELVGHALNRILAMPALFVEPGLGDRLPCRTTFRHPPRQFRVMPGTDPESGRQVLLGDFEIVAEQEMADVVHQLLAREIAGIQTRRRIAAVILLRLCARKQALEHQLPAPEMSPRRPLRNRLKFAYVITVAVYTCPISIGHPIHRGQDLP